MKFFLKIFKVFCKRYIFVSGFRRKFFLDKYCLKFIILWDFKKKKFLKERFFELLFNVYVLVCIL